MKEKLESLPLPQLKEMAKSLGLKGISNMKKAAVIELLMTQEAKSGSAGKPAETQDNTGGTKASAGPQDNMSGSKASAESRETRSAGRSAEAKDGRRGRGKAAGSQETGKSAE
ncbi:MAG: Rho termination factor N-terminal domain-containing protein, partial [Lachnospiraceae bacterium]|nr:Rho termination factor N-terminal domain-containing protein [Lachnospiraceae bacterium]